MDLTSLMKQSTLEVTCGNLQGTLHLDRFMCPGIHSLCIEYDGLMVTPKRFTILGEKQSLKDWKKALRINKIPLRDVMDKGYLDFASHETSCTAKCLGRTPSKALSPMLTESKYPPVMTEIKYTPTPTPTPKTVTHVLDMPNSPGSGTGPIITEVLGGQEHTYCHLSNGGELDSESSGVRPSQLFVNTPNKPLVYVMGDNSAPGVRIKSEPLSPAPSPKPDGQVDEMVSENFGLDELMELADRKHSAYKPVTDAVEDSLKFWDGIIALGLMEDFMKEIKISLDILKQRLVHPVGDIEAEAVKLSSVVKDLGLFRLLHQKMVDLQRETHKQQDRLDAEISVLEKQWSETQKRKSNLAKRQMLLDQVKTSSRLKKRNGVQRTDGLAHRKHVSHSPSISQERARSGSPLASKSQDSTIIITVNEMDDESSAPTPPVAARTENEDFLVTITTGRSQSTMEDGLKDKILNERQQELEGDMEVEDPLQTKVEAPRQGKRRCEDSEIVSNGSSRRKRLQAERIVNAQEDD